MREKGKFKTFVRLTSFLLIVMVLFAANLFMGNPVSSKIAKNRALAYIGDNYGPLNLDINYVTYNPKDSSYIISVFSNTSIDTHFFLSYRDGDIYRDDYESAVLSGMNTMDRFCIEYKNEITVLIGDKTKYVTNISVIPEKQVKYNIDIDSEFDKSLIGNATIIISCIGGTDAKHLSEVLKTCYGTMKENGYTAAKFEITGQHVTSLTELRNIKPTHIESVDLEEVLQEAIINTEYDGITAFGKGL